MLQMLGNRLILLAILPFLSLSLVLPFSCPSSCHLGLDYSVTAVNKTDEEIVVYLGLWSTDNTKTSDRIEYYWVGDLSPGKTWFNDRAAPVDFYSFDLLLIIAERKEGQKIYYSPTVLPWSTTENEHVIYKKVFTHREFDAQGNRVVIK